MELDSKVLVSLCVTCLLLFLQLPVKKMGTKEPWRWQEVRQKKVGWYMMLREDVTGGYMTPLGGLCVILKAQRNKCSEISAPAVTSTR